MPGLPPLAVQGDRSAPVGALRVVGRLVSAGVLRVGGVVVDDSERVRGGGVGAVDEARHLPQQITNVMPGLLQLVKLVRQGWPRRGADDTLGPLR
ncbi:hypothetical protein OG423_05755 [Micromonospora zamorensis]|uniref:hypothetical protein n=1 Tax=Micromonospora zamorensis TaxID=709883 RepID=UPI00352A96EE|nr:hypothetical protein OG423_05755 [Micromonospora zamorensis]